MRLFLTAAALAAIAAPAFAQRADDNAVKSADDAFGTSVGNETIGLYNPFDVRGFSAVEAGNVRIDGLYFDRQADLTALISPSNSMRVGIAAQGYPLPAPTGIADYDLVRVGDRRVVSVIGQAGPFDSASLELDAKLPIVAGKLGLALGGFYSAFNNETGAQEHDAQISVAAQWRPTARIEVIPFYMRAQVLNAEAQPLLFVDGPHLPPTVRRGHFYGQRWADNDNTGVNYGVVTTVGLGDWTAKAGVFRSAFIADHSFADLFLDVTPAGMAHRLIIADPQDKFASSSGEARLSRTFESGQLRSTVYLIARARDQRRRYGGSDVIDFGPAQVGVAVDLPEPAFAFGPQTRERVRQWTGAAAYRGVLDDAFELSAGLQRTDYRKTVAQPSATPVTGRDKVWLYNVGAAWHASPRLAVYASYTRGLEEGGVAPAVAVNKDAAPPAIRTRQWDAGVRYALTPELKLVAGVFDVEKPYYNLDRTNLFRRLGVERHRGLEVSVSGQIAPGLNVVAGGVLMRPRVSGEEVDLGLIGKVPVGQVRRQVVAGADYQIPWIPKLSATAALTYYGKREASADNRLDIPQRAVLDVGARYRFEALGAPASVRLNLANVFNKFGWRNSPSAAFVTNAQRRVSITVAADF